MEGEALQEGAAGHLLGRMGFGFFNALSRRDEIPADYRAEKPEEGIRDEAFNFAFRHPGKPWMPINAPRLNKLAKFAMARGGKSQMFFIIIPEKSADGEAPARQGRHGEPEWPGVSRGEEGRQGLTRGDACQARAER
jgi:hypothetical protein